MAYATELDNTDPSTQMPSSREDLQRVEPVNKDIAQQPEPSDANRARLEVDETLPAIQIPSPNDDRARLRLTVTKTHVTFQSSDFGGTSRTAHIEDVRQELRGLGVLSDEQVDRVIQGLVKSAPYRASAVNKAFDVFSPLSRPPPQPSHHHDPRLKEFVKNKFFTTPPPKQVKTLGAPRPYKPTESPPAPKRRKISSSNPVADLKQRIGNLETTVQDLNAVLLSYNQLPMPQPFSNFTQPPMPQEFSTFTQQPNLQPSSPPTSEPNSCRLLSLPGELRNRIYYAALVSDRTIEIDKARWSTHQPALLKTCKTIRVEAYRLFYLENKISTNIHDWNPVVKYEFQKLMAKHRIRPMQLNHYFTGGPNWDNLMNWLQAVHQGRIGAISDAVGKQRPIERKTIGIMFKIVRKATGVSAWSQVEDLLVAHRELLGMNDARWLPPPEEEEEPATK